MRWYAPGWRLRSWRLNRLPDALGQSDPCGFAGWSRGRRACGAAADGRVSDTASVTPGRLACQAMDMEQEIALANQGHQP
jgi:hypothetical protein